VKTALLRGFFFAYRGALHHVTPICNTKSIDKPEPARYNKEKSLARPQNALLLKAPEVLQWLFLFL
jgi:hypothetical protein